MEKEKCKSSTREAKREGEADGRTGGRPSGIRTGDAVDKGWLWLRAEGKKKGAHCRMSPKSILVLRLDDSTRSMRQWAGILQMWQAPPLYLQLELDPYFAQDRDQDHP